MDRLSPGPLRPQLSQEQSREQRNEEVSALTLTLGAVSFGGRGRASQGFPCQTGCSQCSSWGMGPKPFSALALSSNVPSIPLASWLLPEGEMRVGKKAPSRHTFSSNTMIGCARGRIKGSLRLPEIKRQKTCLARSCLSAGFHKKNP